LTTHFCFSRLIFRFFIRFEKITEIKNRHEILSSSSQRTLSRVGTASSSKSPEPRMKAMSAVGTSRNRKSWAENMLEKENGPFFNQRESSEEDGIVYSQSFDDEEQAPIDSMSSTPEIQESSSLESVEERMQTPSSSREFVVPQVSILKSTFILYK